MPNVRTPRLWLAVLLGMGTGLFALPGTAAGQNCPDGTFSIVQSEDGAMLSILFDQFIVSSGAEGPQKSCDLHVPLNLPEGMSLGVYRVDYRGFAHLAKKEQADLTVVHRLGGDRKGHRFHRKVKSVDGDFTFTENIGAGLMKRAGCGSDAALDVTIALSLEAGSPEAMAALDTADGAPKGGLVYHLDTKKCRA